jgi:hypothetical protein
MKARHVLLASLFLGSVLGVGWTWADFGAAPPLLTPPAERRPESDPQGLHPRLEIAAIDHDFGVVEGGAKVHYAFRITNGGPGTLKLKAGSTSCSACTIAEIQKPEVPPGGSTDVIVEYTAGNRRDKFRQTATVLTNDRQRPRLELSIHGTVTSKLVARPFGLELGNVAVGDAAAAETKLLCLIPGELKLVGYTFSNPDTAKFFEVQTASLSSEQLQAEKAHSGVLAMLSLKPGLPLGAFSQTIRFTLDLNGQPFEHDVPVAGTIVSDLAIVGAGWRENPGLLTLGTVQSAQGVRREVMVLVRGKMREQLQIEPLRVEPSSLRVSLGERKQLNENVDQIPLTIEIPPGASPSIHIGTNQWPFGEIVLGVKNHPDLNEIRMRVKFTIE